MNKIENYDFIGYFLKRKNLFKISVIDLLRELQTNLFEAKIMKNAVQDFQLEKINSFDCSIGDWKCQTRTSMLIDILDHKTNINQNLKDDLIKIENIILKTQDLFNQINEFNIQERQALTQILQVVSLKKYLDEKDLIYQPSETTKLLSLFFMTTLKNVKSYPFLDVTLSANKIKALIIKAKILLCELSIQHEKNTAEELNCFEKKTILQQSELKGFCSMTSLFASFKSLFQKMKFKKQSLIIQLLKFCTCGGIQKIEVKFFDSSENFFKEKTNIKKNSNQAITVIYSYQFPGSLEKLQNILNISNTETSIPASAFKSCHCKNPTQHPNVDSIDEAIMAFFAQHPQFTNGAEIDWQGLGLENSELKKEYDYLKTLKGFSREDMSKFQIIHMYPSTIGNVLKEQEKLQKQLNLPITKK